MEDKLFKMSEEELADYIDEMLSHKAENHNTEPVTYKDLRLFSRILQLQLNHIIAKADMGKYFAIAMGSTLPKDMKKAVLDEMERLKDADNDKITKELKDSEEKI